MRTTCRRHADDTKVRFQVRFHRQMTYVICMPSAHLPELPNFMQYYTWCHPHIVCMLSAHRLQTHMSSACHLHVICTHMSSACHPHHLHTSLSCPISCSTTPGIICMSSADTHVICMSSAHHLQICTSFAQSSWTIIVFPVPEILVIDVTVVPDVVPDVAMLKTYCLHIIPGSLRCPYGPQLCFLSQKY